MKHLTIMNLTMERTNQTILPTYSLTKTRLQEIIQSPHTTLHSTYPHTLKKFNDLMHTAKDQAMEDYINRYGYVPNFQPHVRLATQDQIAEQAIRTTTFYNVNRRSHLMIIANFSELSTQNLYSTLEFQALRYALQPTIQKGAYPNQTNERVNKLIILHDTATQETIKLKVHADHSLKDPTARAEHIITYFIDSQTRTVQFNCPSNWKKKFLANFPTPEQQQAELNRYGHPDYPTPQADHSMTFSYKAADTFSDQTRVANILKYNDSLDQQIYNYGILHYLDAQDLINKEATADREKMYQELDQLRTELRTMKRTQEYLAKLDRLWELEDQLESKSHDESYMGQSPSVEDKLFN